MLFLMFMQSLFQFGGNERAITGRKIILICPLLATSFVVLVTHIFGSKIWGSDNCSDMNFRGKVLGTSPPTSQYGVLTQCLSECFSRIFSLQKAKFYLFTAIANSTRGPIIFLMQLSISFKTISPPPPGKPPGYNLKGAKTHPRDNHCVQKPSPLDRTGSQKPHPRDIKLENFTSMSINSGTI